MEHNAKSSSIKQAGRNILVLDDDNSHDWVITAIQKLIIINIHQYYYPEQTRLQLFMK